MPDRPDPPVLILASRSPRRAQLLWSAGYRPVAADPHFQDPPQPENGGPSAEVLAVELANQKAESLRALAPPNAVILAADTICVGTDGALIGQPKDLNDAEAMIRGFMNATHRVVTGVSLVTQDGDALSFADQAEVKIGTVSDDQLATYLNTDQWRGKAGGYNLFDRQRDGWPLEVLGDPTTVVGLPMNKLKPALAQLGVHPEPTGKPKSGNRQSLLYEIMGGQNKRISGRLARIGLSLLRPGYGLIVWARNTLFDRGLRIPVQLPRPTISVGNLTTGGTGKTPMVIELAKRLIEQGSQPAVLLRGYRAEGDSGGSDEAMMLEGELGSSVPVMPDPSRVAGAKRVTEKHPQTDVFLLDDGFQHRQAHRELDIVLIDATRPFGFGHLLPRGLLREPAKNLRRADAVIVTRCGMVDQRALNDLDHRITQLYGRPPIAHVAERWTGFRENDTVLPSDHLKDLKVVTASAIGNPRGFWEMSRAAAGEVVYCCDFDDHHRFTLPDVFWVLQCAKLYHAQAVLITEKDWVKWKTLPGSFNRKPLREGAPPEFRILRPILGVEFIDGEDEVDRLLEQAVKPAK